jgi:hypothetical protein
MVLASCVKTQAASTHTSFSGSHILKVSSNRCLNEVEKYIPPAKSVNIFLNSFCIISDLKQTKFASCSASEEAHYRQLFF